MMTVGNSLMIEDRFLSGTGIVDKIRNHLISLVLDMIMIRFPDRIFIFAVEQNVGHLVDSMIYALDFGRYYMGFSVSPLYCLHI